MTIIDIDGPSAIGKTTLIHQLHLKIPNVSSVDELLMQAPNPFNNWSTSEDFLKKQLWFFENTLKRYPTITAREKSCNMQINDIGIIDVIIHTAIFPIVNKLPWNVFPQFKHMIINNYSNLNLANTVLYLYASEQVLRQRKEYDSLRIRNAFESNMKLYPLQKSFYSMLKNTFPNQVFCLNAELSSDDIISEVIKIRKKHSNTAPLHLYDLLDFTDSFFFHK